MTHQQSPGTAPILTDEDRDERRPETQTIDGEVVDPTATPTREVDPPTQTPTQTGPVDPDPADPTDPDPDNPPDPDDPVPAPAATDRADTHDVVDTDPETAAAEADREATAPRPEPVEPEFSERESVEPVDTVDTEPEPELADAEPDFDREAELARDATLEPSAAIIDASDSTALAGRAETTVVDSDAPVAGAVPDEAVEHAPGEVEQSPVADLWPAATADSLRARWQELQLRFVDDPQGAAAEADAVAAEAVEALTSALTAQRTELAQWRTDREGDTEGLRVAVQRYHAFLDRVLGL